MEIFGQSGPSEGLISQLRVVYVDLPHTKSYMKDYV